MWQAVVCHGFKEFSPLFLLQGQRWGDQGRLAASREVTFAALEVMQRHLYSDLGLFLWPGIPQLPPAPEELFEVCGGQRANPLGPEVSPPALLCSSPGKHWCPWKVQGAFIHPPAAAPVLQQTPGQAGFGCARPGMKRKRIQMLHSHS